MMNRPRSVRPKIGFAVTLAMLALTASVVGQATTSAVPSVATSAPGGDFELFSATGMAQPNPVGWAGWDFLGNSGIASKGASVLGNTTVEAPGVCVAYLGGTGIVRESNLMLPSGVHRVLLRAARRLVGGSHDDQGIRILVNGTEVFSDPIPSGDFSDVVTDPFFVLPGMSTALVIEAAEPGSSGVVAIDRVETQQARVWQATSTWTLGVPTTGVAATIPSGAFVAIDGPASCESVTVNGVLTATPISGSLTAHWITAQGEGARIVVGTEKAPHVGDFDFILNDVDTNANHHNAGTNFLMAMAAGKIDLHGSSKTSWTKLQSIGDTNDTITVDDVGGWQIGDSVVIAYTGHVNHASPNVLPNNIPNPYTGPKSVVRRIAAIGPAPRTLTLSRAISPSDHCTVGPTLYQDQNMSRSWKLDQRAEVGMLSHNIKICGEPNNPLGFGAHVMIMACCPNMEPGFARIRGVEFHNVGQLARLGRYPMHWHMQRENGFGQYIKSSSIWESHNRAMTIHGSHGVLLDDNVCYDILGHAVFLEDGVERNNVIRHNLVLATKKPILCRESMIPHDASLDQPQNRSPAAFWISHPTNELIDNVAADSLGVGYWFALHTRPTGLSASGDPASYWIASFDQGITPIPSPWNATKEPLGRFFGNVCHSSKMAIDIHDSIQEDTVDISACTAGMNPPQPVGGRTDPRNDDILTNVMWQPPSGAVIEGLVAYGCTTGIYTGGGIVPLGTIRFENCVLADNGLHVQLASMDTVADSVFIYNTGNGIFPGPTSTPPLVPDPFSTATPYQPYERGNAYVVYDGPGGLENCHFIGFDGPSGGNFVYGEFGAARRHTNHRFDGLTFGALPGIRPNVIFMDYASAPGAPLLQEPMVWGFNLLLGSAGPSLIGNHPMNHLRALGGGASDARYGTNAFLSPHPFGHLQIRYYTPSGASWTLLEGDRLPHADFRRLPVSPWVGAGCHDGSDGKQMRQIPVVTRDLRQSSGTEFVYEVDVLIPPPAVTAPVRRVDVSLDDVAPGISVRVRILNHIDPHWLNGPTVQANQPRDLEILHTNGFRPQDIPRVIAAQTPPVHPAPPVTNPMTTWFLDTSDPLRSVLDLRIVSITRTGRISITW